MVRLARDVVVSRYVAVFSDAYDGACDECAGDIEPGAGEGYGDCNGFGDGDGKGSGADGVGIDGPITGDGSGNRPCWGIPDYGAGGESNTYRGQGDADDDHPHPDAQIGHGSGRGAGNGGGDGYGDGRARWRESGDGEGSGDGFGDGIGNAHRLDNGVDSTFVEEMAFTGGNGHALGDGSGDGDVWEFSRDGVMARAPRLKP